MPANPQERDTIQTMCNLYQPSLFEKIDIRFAPKDHLGLYKPWIGPLGMGPIVLPGNRAKLAQWGLIPPNSPTKRPATPDGKPLSTNNARRERLSTALSFRDAWKRGQRCIVPADSFDEPYWGTGKNIWWRFWRADGDLWALAGLWSEWTDPATGEVVPSYTLITQNCDGHPLLALMHKPEKDKATGEVLPADKQDKRTVVPLEEADWDTWLNGTIEETEALIKVPPVESFKHGAADPAKQVTLSL